MTLKITIFYPSDPLGPKIGGSETFLKGFIQNAPDDIDLDYVGITSYPEKRPLRKWTNLQLGKKSFRFFPLFFVHNENKRSVIPLSLRFSFYLLFYYQLFNKGILFFNRIEPALLYLFSPRPKLAVIHCDIQKQTDKRYSEVFWSRIPWLYFYLEKYIFSSLDAIYTVTKNSLDFYYVRYPHLKNRLFFLPNWPNPLFFFPQQRNKSDLRKELFTEDHPVRKCTKWILFVGRLQKAKDPLKAINVFSEYHKNDSSSCLLIVGEGDLQPNVRKHITDSGLQNNVYLLGNKTPKELSLLYNASDVLLVTSHYEGMPLNVLEALACGLPVASPNVGEVHQVIKNGFSGEISCENTVDSIRASLEKILKHPGEYTEPQCLQSIETFKPQRILTSLYETFRKLHQKTGCQKRGVPAA